MTIDPDLRHLNLKLEWMNKSTTLYALELLLGVTCVASTFTKEQKQSLNFYI